MLLNFIDETLVVEKVYDLKYFQVMEKVSSYAFDMDKPLPNFCMLFIKEQPHNNDTTTGHSAK